MIDIEETLSAADGWSLEEISHLVRAYLEMLEDEISGWPIDKKAINAQLRVGVLSKRTAGSIEYRMQNISTVLAKMGCGWIERYKPSGSVGPTNANLKAVFGPVSSYVLCFGEEEVLGTAAIISRCPQLPPKRR